MYEPGSSLTSPSGHATPVSRVAAKSVLDIRFESAQHLRNFFFVIDERPGPYLVTYFCFKLGVLSTAAPVLYPFYHGLPSDPSLRKNG